MNDFIRLGNLLKRKQSPYEKEREDKAKDLRAFKRFIMRKKPDIIVIAAESRECMNIQKDFVECAQQAHREEDMDVASVDLIDPCLARIYAKTQRARVSRCYTVCTSE